MTYFRGIMLSYLLCINLCTFCLRGRDKYCARTKRRRISEKKLLKRVIYGGGLGALLGMEIRRHKTIKGTFLKRFWTVVSLQITIILALRAITSYMIA